MLHTSLCDLLGIDAPVIQASIGPWSSPELTAAVSNAGGLGSYGTALRAPDQLEADFRRLAELTDKPYAINHTFRPFSEEAFALSLDARPRAISIAIGADADLVRRAHDAGCLLIQQVHTVEQAIRAAEMGADVVIAQGGEAGGFSGAIGALTLVPQVVDAVAPLPVVAAGGIADGRGLAAALVLGAQGVNVGTRFVASAEAAVSDDFKRGIVAAAAEDAVKVEFADSVFPPTGPQGYATLPRALASDWVRAGNADPTTADADELMIAARAGRAEALVPFAGQSAGLVHEVLEAGEIVRRLVAEAEAALRSAGA